MSGVVDWTLFFQTNPYEDFNAAAFPLDLQGWGADHPIFEALIQLAKPRLIVEIGTWKGASAMHMASVAKSMDLPTTLICIDTWLGTIESYSWRDRHPDLHSNLMFRNGWPNIFYQFLANVVHSKYEEIIVPLPQTSLIGLRLLRELQIKPNLIYIDASHDYHDVLADLALAWECAEEGAVIFGDDYVAWPGVTCAVQEFAKSKRASLLGAHGKFAFGKNTDLFSMFCQNRMVSSDGTCGGLSLVPL